MNLITPYNFLEGDSRGGGADLPLPVASNRAGGNGVKLCQGQFRLDFRKSVSLRG